MKEIKEEIISDESEHDKVMLWQKSWWLRY